MSKKRFLPLLGCSLLWGALVIPLSSAALQVALETHRDSFGREFLAILPWAFVLLALPGTVLSFLGGVWIESVGAATHRTIDLATHGLLAGALLSLPFFIFGLLGTAKGSGNEVVSFFLLTLVFGAANGVAYALVFRRTLFGLAG